MVWWSSFIHSLPCFAWIERLATPTKEGENSSPKIVLFAGDFYLFRISTISEGGLTCNSWWLFMMIGLLQLRPSAGPCQFCSGVAISEHPFSSYTSLRRRVSYAAKGSCKPQNCACFYKPRSHVVFYHQNAPRWPSFIRRKCQRIDNRSETSRDEGNGVWVNSTDEILKRSHLEENEQKVIALDESQKLEDGKDLGTNGHVDNMSLPEKFNNSFEDEGNGVWIKGANEVLKRSQENEQKGVALNESQRLEDGKDLGTNGYVDKLSSPENLSNSVEDEAWDLLRESMVYYCGTPVGTIAAKDPSSTNMLNYDQVFIRDFIPSGIAFLLKGEYEIVRNFILHTLQLQSWEKTMDCHSPGQGLMPASFKVRVVPLDGDDSATEEVLDPDFGEAAIGRVAPVDSGLWWIILLRAYGKCSGDRSVQDRIDVQTGIRMILKLCLADGFDMFPTLLVTDGSCMIDRRMGIHGHPLEIQALFYSALYCAREMLAPDDGSDDLIRALNNRLVALSFHIREYYWIDMKKLNEIYRYKTEEYSYDAVNKFNIYPDQIPPWLVEWMPDKGGYLIGNLQPAHMDFRFFSLGNLWSIVCSLATRDQSHAILDLIEAKWNDLVADMPFKICYPALEGQEWRIITGSDPKNTPWSYHNGGSWPTLLWQLTVACIKMGRPELALRAVEIAERRLSTDKWPEYYDTKRARFVGKQAQYYQTWSIAGFLVAKLLLQNQDAAKMLMNEEDAELINIFYYLNGANPRKKRGQRSKSYII